MPDANNLAIIGGGAAGMSAASRARRNAPDLAITVFEASDFVSHIACGLPYFVADIIKDYHDLLVYSPDFFRNERRIEVYTGHRVDRVNPDARLLKVTNLDSGQSWEQPFGKLVIAGGGGPVAPRIDGIGLPGIFTLHSIASGIAIKDFIRMEKPRRVVIVGGGYIGLEMAEALGMVGLDVTIIEALPHVMPPVDPDMAQVIEEELLAHNIKLRLGEPVKAFEGDGHVQRVVTGQASYDTDFVILSIGVRANSPLALEAGVAIGRTGAIMTDERMATNIPGIYAAGDVAEACNQVTGRPVYIPLGTTANKQGRVAGDNATGGNAVFRGIVGTAITRVFDLEIGRTGLTESQARQEGFEPVSSVIKHNTKAKFFPGTQPITMKLIGDRISGRMLGAQIVGGSGSAKRVDVAAVAIQQNMPVSAVPDLDLGYAPPLSPVWDAVQIAAQELEKKVAQG